MIIITSSLDKTLNLVIGERLLIYTITGEFDRKYAKLGKNIDETNIWYFVLKTLSDFNGTWFQYISVGHIFIVQDIKYIILLERVNRIGVKNNYI